MSYINVKQADGTIVKVPLGRNTEGAVRYDTEQNLTAEQKAQARENIGVKNEIYVGGGDMPDWAMFQIILDDDYNEDNGNNGDNPINTFTVTNNLTNVSTNNSVTTITEGMSYRAVLTPTEGYAISNYTITMGGEDITQSVYANRVINIPNVSSNVVITVNTTKTSYTNLLPTAKDTDGTTIFNELGYISGYRLNSSGNLTDQTGSFVTGFIPYTYQGGDDKIRVKNTGWCSSANTQGVWGYDSNYNFVGIIVSFGKSTDHTSFEDFVAGPSNGIVGKYWTKEVDGQYMVTFVPSEGTDVASGTMDISKVAYIRIFMGDFANAIITVNEEIV